MQNMNITKSKIKRDNLSFKSIVLLLKKALNILVTFCKDVYRVYLKRFIFDTFVAIFCYVFIQTLMIVVVIIGYDFSNSMVYQTTKKLVGDSGIVYLKSVFEYFGYTLTRY